jgi:hypothetical protein
LDYLCLVLGYPGPFPVFDEGVNVGLLAGDASLGIGIAM